MSHGRMFGCGAGLTFMMNTLLIILMQYEDKGIQPWPLAIKRLLNKPYVNEVYLTGQNPPLICFYSLKIYTQFEKSLDLFMLKILSL